MRNISQRTLPQICEVGHRHRSFNTQMIASSKSLRQQYCQQNFNPISIRSRYLPLQMDSQINNYQHQGGQNGFCNKKENKRNTLQRPLQSQNPVQYVRGLQSPAHLTSINHKINFTYNSPPQYNSQSALTLVYSSLQVLRKASKRMEVNLQIVKSKQIRNRLSSNQFNITYSPNHLSKMEEYNQQVSSRKTFLSVQQSDRTNLNKRLVSQSKITSTVATRSFFKQNHRSDFYNEEGLSSSKTYNLRSKSAKNLLEIIPFRKQLGKTVILSNNQFNFGGLLEQANTYKPLRSVAETLNQVQPPTNQLDIRQWSNNIKFLSSEETENLKESIHCGPQIRLQYKFDVLNDYGRSIKQSTMSFYQ